MLVCRRRPDILLLLGFPHRLRIPTSVCTMHNHSTTPPNIYQLQQSRLRTAVPVRIPSAGMSTVAHSMSLVLHCSLMAVVGRTRASLIPIRLLVELLRVRVALERSWLRPLATSSASPFMAFDRFHEMIRRCIGRARYMYHPRSIWSHFSSPRPITIIPPYVDRLGKIPSPCLYCLTTVHGRRTPGMFCSDRNPPRNHTGPALGHGEHQSQLKPEVCLCSGPVSAGSVVFRPGSAVQMLK